jgi:hypothetical protein
MSEAELQLKLENRLQSFADLLFWIDEFNDDYIYIACPKWYHCTDIECERIYKIVKELTDSLNLRHIFVGPFVWNLI